MKLFRRCTVALLIASLSIFATCDSQDAEEESALDDETTQLILLVGLLNTQNNIASSSCRQNIAGCTSTQFSCTASASCYASLALCANSGTCPAGSTLEQGPLATNQNKTGFVDPNLIEGVDFFAKSH